MSTPSNSTRSKRRGSDEASRPQAKKSTIASLSQTVDENRTNIQTLMSLPEVVNKQSEMLQEIMQTISDRREPVDNDSVRCFDDLSDDGFVNGIMNSVQMKHGDTPGHEMPNDESVSEIVLEVLQSNEGEHDFGLPLCEPVVDAFQRAINQNLNKEGLDKLRSVHKPPENFKQLGAPKVNSEIWNQLPRRAQTQDASFQYLQQFLSRGLVAQARMAECLSRYASNIPPEVLRELLTYTMDTANQIGYSFRDVSLRRRQQIKPFMTNESSSLCTTNVPVTEFLFGNNLDKELQAARASAKIMKSSMKPFARTHYQPSNFQPKKQQSSNFQSVARNLNWKRPLHRGGRRPIQYQRPRFPSQQQMQYH